MPVTGQTIRVDGLRQLNVAFARLDKNTAKEVRDGLKTAAEPVKVGAEVIAVTDMKRGNIPWWQMRVGTTPAFVYVAPKQRSRNRGNPRFRRPNLARKLLEAEVTSLRQNQGQVERNVEKTMTDLANDWGRGG
jgi:hypothetical protein